MHLRCLIPPQTIAPSGQFFCPACDVGFKNSVAELADAKMPWLQLQEGSPHQRTFDEILMQ